MTDAATTACRFSPERLSRLAQIERRHFWFTGRRAFVDKFLDEHLKGDAPLALDLGCGTGSTLEHLAAQCCHAVGVDLMSEGLKQTRRTLPDASLLQADAAHLSLASDSFDLALLLDVLEHVDDEAA